jgi:hypothetical protein
MRTGQLILLCQQPRNTTKAAPATPVAIIPRGHRQRDFFFSSTTGHNLVTRSKT